MHGTQAKCTSMSSMWDPHDDEIRKLREELDEMISSQASELLTIKEEMTRLYGGVIPPRNGDVKQNVSPLGPSQEAAPSQASGCCETKTPTKLQS
ncbi:unnamed protein product [Cuscuta campestris]|uniref:Uncharacterized protein n=1 Tax=Cuscuta campestris TaxID=132261 RepID=A0A484L6U2_9ASTE|nr:unnamed protein product [Cuscuta campestris]